MDGRKEDGGRNRRKGRENERREGMMGKEDKGREGRHLSNIGHC